MVNSIVKAYLVAYNAAQAVGWLVVLSKLGQSYVDTGDFNHAFVAAGNLVRALQLAAFLEFLHASFGLVRSGALTSLMQWGGRTHVLLAVIAKLPEAQVLPSVFIVFTAWSISEVIRYPQYALSSLGACPRWLVWLRYTAFILLYPAGIYGEMNAMYISLKPIADRQLYSGIFGQLLPFTYDKFVLGLLIAYPFLFVILFLHMFKQRRSKLSVRSSANRRTSKGKGKRRD
ncbi:very-long-chain (3R)-3-hydroxyacyl-CoA dehydratase [Marchantia polymorpha subsp. ruderalis]|uniref:Very-long-chain (3R)-3-hydroxyacyl-CoA dehydratase n=1 Tax=Marchantia polymorpha subsp. ruderalis TaxID=1480154 RepID=A0AAF6BLT9_MARPO|nr:hypothetical protein Mp_5g24450 [Marchantia polymorpha subsp. ruderalis]BBN12973.1 hypothetical protein Mp_5g24450 [Marchantia polymorpha subsp. ruderalis]